MPPGQPLAGAIVGIAERSGAEDEPTLGVILGRQPGLFRRNRLVDQVIEPPAESIEPRRAIGMRRSEQPASPVEAPSLTGQGRLRRGRRGMRGGLAHEAAGMRASMTLAEQSTPGTPAPGCVPAPTK